MTTRARTGRTPRWMRSTWSKFLVGSVGSGLLLFGGIYVYCLLAGKAMLEGELAKARAIGMPLTAEELLKGHEVVTDEENAATLLEPLYRELETTRINRPVIDVTPTTDGTEMAVYLEPSLKRGLKALERPGYDSKINLNAVPTFDYSEFDGLKELAKHLVLSARKQMYRGNLDEAFRRLEAAMRLAESAGRTPAAYPLSVRSKVEEDVYRGLEAMLCELQSTAMVQAAERFVSKEREPYDLKRSIAGELVLMRAMLNKISETGDLKFYRGDSPMNLEERWALTTMFSDPYREGFEARQVRMMRICYEAMPADPLDYKATKAAFEKMYRAPSTEGWLYGAAMDRTLSYGGTAELQVTAEARSRVAKAAIEMIRNGSSKPVGVDPFNNAPLRVRRDGDTSFVYSVGSNGFDDNADPKIDIVFEIRR